MFSEEFRMRSTFFIMLACSSAETTGIGTCSMCERSNLTELNLFEIKKAATLELPQFIRTAQKSPYVGNIKF